MNANETYSALLKSELAELPVHRTCCRRALFAGLLYCKTPEETGVAAELSEKLARELKTDIADCGDGRLVSLVKCENCAGVLIRGLFISVGMMSDPETGYRLEFPLPSEDLADEVGALLSGVGLEPKKASRRGKTVLYYKESSSIEDMLGIIGAKKAAFELMNIKIERELRNNANRQTNCDAANISKTVSASEQQIDAIEYLRKNGLFDMLPEDLRRTALLRLENSDASLSALVKLHDEHISRSGVNHRLARITSIAAEEREKARD